MSSGSARDGRGGLRAHLAAARRARRFRPRCRPRQGRRRGIPPGSRRPGGRPGLEDTPRRMVDAYTELLTPRPFDLTTFPNEEGYDELVLARGIPVQSVCEHHVL